MPVFDCNGELVIHGDVSDRIEADTAEEAEREFVRRAKAGDYDTQAQVDPRRTLRTWTPQDDT